MMIGNILRQRYKIVKELKKGGFGETYLAEDLDIPVTPKPIRVVKRLNPTEIDRDTIRLFKQEAEILYKLGQNHDQISKLYAHFQEGEDFYLIQEFIDGYDLRQEITPGKKLSEGDVIQLLRDVLEILVYVHDNKIIHRDINPANIMRRKDGKLVLIDFGVIKQINNTIAMQSGSATRTINIGTPGYKPLEQAMGKPKFSSDIYALGMTAIQSLIDLSPRLLAEDDDGEIIWIDQVEITDKLEQFISKMVRYDWRERYRNANEALNELNQIFGVVKKENIHPAQLTELSEICVKQNDESVNLDKPEEVIESYNEAIDIQSDKHENWYHQGDNLRALQRYEEAIESYDKAIAIKSDYYEAWYKRGLTLTTLQRYKEAIESYDKAIAVKSDYHEVWYNRGNILKKLKRYKEAISSYNKAIAIQPNDLATWNNRGNILKKLKRYEEAISSYDKAIAIQPNDPRAWNQRGNVLKTLKRYEGAILAYDKTIAIQPNNAYAWHKRGICFCYLQIYEEALKSYEKAISIKRRFKLAINNRNDLLKQLGRLN